MEGRASCMPYLQNDATFLFVKLENSFYSVAVVCILVPGFRQSSHGRRYGLEENGGSAGPEWEPHRPT
jgi:hypothetical protein